MFWSEREGFLFLTVMPRPVPGESCATSIKDFTNFPPHKKKIYISKATKLVYEAVIRERGSWRAPPRSHVGAHTIKRAVSVCPHFLASISRFRLLSQDRKLCLCRLGMKMARSRR